MRAFSLKKKAAVVVAGERKAWLTPAGCRWFVDMAVSAETQVSAQARHGTAMSTSRLA